MDPNGKCRRYPEAATFRITGGELIQGEAPGPNKLFQINTCGTHTSPI